MRTIYDIARAELKLMFYSPIAWLIVIIFTVQLALRFTGTFGGLVASTGMGNQLPGGLTETLFVSPFGGLYPTVLHYLYLYICERLTLKRNILQEHILKFSFHQLIQYLLKSCR